MERDNKQAVLAVNDRFYAALTEADLEAMIKIWHRSDAVECIHPGWDRLRGWEAVRESWERIFENQGPLPVKPSHARVHIRGEMAWVICYENILIAAERTFQISRTVATNVFERLGGEWQMVVHHASPAPDDNGRQASLN